MGGIIRLLLLLLRELLVRTVHAEVRDLLPLFLELLLQISSTSRDVTLLPEHLFVFLPLPFLLPQPLVVNWDRAWTEAEAAIEAVERVVASVEFSFVGDVFSMSWSRTFSSSCRSFRIINVYCNSFIADRDLSGCDDAPIFTSRDKEDDTVTSDRPSLHISFSFEQVMASLSAGARIDLSVQSHGFVYGSVEGCRSVCKGDKEEDDDDDDDVDGDNGDDDDDDEDWTVESVQFELSTLLSMPLVMPL